ncbi:MAG: phosphoenolpyruvate--protein phosphotransferase [candidate division WOR-3 bacterium]
MRERILRGIPISPGIGIGRVFFYQRELPKVEEREIAEEGVEREVNYFFEKIGEVERELNEVYQKVREEMGRDVADLVMFQILLLKDKEINGRVEKLIREKRRDAASAYYQVIREYTQTLLNSSLPFLKEREVDIIDCAHRVLRSLLPKKNDTVEFLLGNWHSKKDIILFASNLTPTEVAILDKEFIKGVALAKGGKLSHVAIMTKAKEIPAVDGVDDLLKEENKNRWAILDGDRGIVIINPTERRLLQYEREVREEKRKRALYSLSKEEEPVTKDGKYIDLSANIEFIGEVDKAKELGAKGIGLLRTEYLFLSRRRPPSEEEQFFFYREVANKMKPYPVIIRTFDLGGDKVIPGYRELNPFLGWRGIRIGLKEREILKRQMRAILRAGAENKNLKIMLPMISTLEEVQEAKSLLNAVKEELKGEGIPFDPEIELGIMVETPSCALLAERIGRISSFFSIGTNDLTQYTLACARDNEKVSYLYDPFHPAVIRLYKETIEAARKCGIWVGVCGELAAEPLGIILLVGLGVDELSMVPIKIPEAKGIIRELDLTKLQESINKVFTFSTAQGVKRFLIREIKKNFPQLVNRFYG